MTLKGGRLTQTVKNHGAFHWDAEAVLSVPRLTNKGSLRGHSLDVGELVNQGIVDFKVKISADRIDNSPDAVLYAPTIEFRADIPLETPPSTISYFLHFTHSVVEACAIPLKVYLALGNAGSGKNRLSHLFGSTDPFLADNKWLEDRAILHLFGDGAVIDIQAHDADFWLPESSPQTAAHGIRQILSRFGKSVIDGVLLFEALDYDHSSTKRTVHQAKSVLQAMDVGLSTRSTIMIYSGTDMLNQSILQSAYQVLVDEGGFQSCMFAEARQAMTRLESFDIAQTASPLHALDTPLYYQVQRINPATDVALYNRGYLRASLLGGKSMVNTGIIFTDAEIESEQIVNYGLVKCQSLSRGQMHNQGSVLTSSLPIASVFNAGVMSSTRLDPLPNSSLVNFGAFFALRTSSPLSGICNHGRMSLRQLESLSAENSGKLTVQSAVFDDLVCTGETRIKTLTVKNTLNNTATLHSGIYHIYDML